MRCGCDGGGVKCGCDGGGVKCGCGGGGVRCGGRRGWNLLYCAACNHLVSLICSLASRME